MARKPNSNLRALTVKSLAESAPWAAEHIKLVVKGKIKSSPLRIDACKYVINQDLGMPTQKTNLQTSGKLEVIVRWDGNRNTPSSTSERL